MNVSCSTRLAALLMLGWSALLASEGPFLVTYTDQMEEQGNLEIATRAVTGRPAGGGRFLGAAMEFEYGMTGWWTSELYLDGQETANDAAVFTGYRWENRFRLSRRQHWINPVLYFEFETSTGLINPCWKWSGMTGRAI